MKADHDRRPRLWFRIKKKDGSDRKERERTIRRSGGKGRKVLLLLLLLHLPNNLKVKVELPVLAQRTISSFSRSCCRGRTQINVKTTLSLPPQPPPGQRRLPRHSVYHGSNDDGDWPPSETTLSAVARKKMEKTALTNRSPAVHLTTITNKPLTTITNKPLTSINTIISS